MKKKIAVILTLVIIIILIILIATGFKKRTDVVLTDYSVSEDEELIGFTDIPQNFEVEDAIERRYFVIDGREGENKIYNKDVLDSFVENTNINSKNRKPDKIRIANYNYDGYPTIYEVEYKVLDKKYINKEQKETKETGYILTVDASRNNISPRSIVVNDDIPGEFYGITVDEDVGINAAIIKLSLYAIIDYVEEVEPYKDIEITRYLLDDKVVNTEKN